MMHLGLIGAVVGVLFVLWLIPTLIGGLFSGLWWLVKLPFRLVWLLVVEGVGGLLALLWRLCSCETMGVCCLWPLCDAPKQAARQAVFRSPAGEEVK